MFDRSQQISGRKIRWIGAAPCVVDARAAGCRIKIEVAAAQYTGFRCEAAGENHSVARDRLLLSVALDHHGADARSAFDPHQLRARAHENAEQQTRDQVAATS